MTSAAWAEVEVCTLLSAILVIWVFLYQLLHALYQWHRSVRVSQVKPSNCFRCLEKLVLPSIFDTILSFIMTWNLQSYPTTVLNERMQHCRESKHTLTHYYIFSGESRPPKPPGSTPLYFMCLYCILHLVLRVLTVSSVRWAAHWHLPASLWPVARVGGIMVMVLDLRSTDCRFDFPLLCFQAAT